MPLHNCPNCTYTSHRPFDVRRHLRRKQPCNSSNENTTTDMVVKNDGGYCIPIKQKNVKSEHNTIHNKQNTVLVEQNVALNQNVEKHKCQNCKQTFSKISNYQRHISMNRCRGCEPEVCKICLKRFNNTTARATHERRVKCKPPPPKPSNNIPEDSNNIPKPSNNIPEASNNTEEFIYLIQLREFIKTDESVYKIGRTKQSYEKRIKSYPKGSRLLLYHPVDDCVATETKIKQYLCKTFIQRRDLGLEYFEGDCKLIIKGINHFL